MWALAQEPAPRAQLIATIDTGDDMPVVAAWSPDGRRLAYGVEKEVKRRRSPLSLEGGPQVHYPGEVWLTDFNEKPKRLLKHNFLRNPRGDFFSFFVERLAWSPDGTRLAVEITDEEKNTATFLLTDAGKKVKLGSGKRNFVIGYGAEWLGDNETLGLLAEAVSPRLLHRVGLVRVTAGRTLSLFRDKTFAAVAWLPRARKAVLVERDPQFANPPRLMVGDLDSGTLELLDDLEEGYLGGLRATLDETRVSYFVGQEKLAVRSLAPDAPVEYWPIPFGRYEWAREALFFIEPKELGARTGWLTRYDPATQTRQRVLSEVLIQDFWVAPDGERVAVLSAGLKPTLKVYRLPPPSSPAQP